MYQFNGHCYKEIDKQMIDYVKIYLSCGEESGL